MNKNSNIQHFRIFFSTNQKLRNAAQSGEIRQHTVQEPAGPHRELFAGPHVGRVGQGTQRCEWDGTDWQIGYSTIFRGAPVSRMLFDTVTEVMLEWWRVIRSYFSGPRTQNIIWYFLILCLWREWREYWRLNDENSHFCFRSGGTRWWKFSTGYEISLIRCYLATLFVNTNKKKYQMYTQFACVSDFVIICVAWREHNIPHLDEMEPVFIYYPESNHINTQLLNVVFEVILPPHPKVVCQVVCCIIDTLYRCCITNTFRAFSAIGAARDSTGAPSLSRGISIQVNRWKPTLNYARRLNRWLLEFQSSERPGLRKRLDARVPQEGATANQPAEPRATETGLPQFASGRRSSRSRIPQTSAGETQRWATIHMPTITALLIFYGCFWSDKFSLSHYEFEVQWTNKNC